MKFKDRYVLGEGIPEWSDTDGEYPAQVALVNRCKRRGHEVLSLWARLRGPAWMYDAAYDDTEPARPRYRLVLERVPAPGGRDDK